MGLTSDPVAVSSGPNSWDVVAVGTSDYKVYHWWHRPDSPSVKLNVVSDTFKAVGTPAMVSPGGTS